jgi:two-component sensor histidine kinase
VADYVSEVAKWVRMRRSGRAAWTSVAILFALALGLRLALGRHGDPAPFTPFVPGLPVAALLCGWRKAFLLLAASVAAGWALGPAAAGPTVWAFPFATRAVVFASLGAFLILLIEALAQLVNRLDAAAALNAELFRELQHRVANNFQIVAATLHKARRNVTDKAAADALEHATFRIESLGKLHRRLYNPAAYDDGLSPILREVLADTFQNVTVELRLDIASQNLSVAQMTTIVLLVNEAAINAAKHVFARRQGTRFAVSLRTQDRQRVLLVSDDGPGLRLPEGGPSSRYGLNVMRGLAAQLGGQMEIVEGEGAIIRVAFP